MSKTDVSYKSISMLQKKFSDYRKQSICVPDWGVPFDSQLNQPIDVLLMGSYFERIFQLDYWPTQKFKLFCLSPVVRKILIEVFSFDPEVVGCLSRYELFPKSKSEEKFEVLVDTHFYYAGRI